MSQVDLPTSIGYALKRTAVALAAAMDAELRHCDLSVAQYASLELLAQRPGLTNAELARGVFVTRQATHQLLAGLRSAGLIEIQGAGRHQRVVITELGAGRLADASHRIALIEQRMLTPLSAERQAELFQQPRGVYRGAVPSRRGASHGRTEPPLSVPWTLIEGTKVATRSWLLGRVPTNRARWWDAIDDQGF